MNPPGRKDGARRREMTLGRAFGKRPGSAAGMTLGRAFFTRVGTPPSSTRSETSRPRPQPAREIRSRSQSSPPGGARAGSAPVNHSVMMVPTLGRGLIRASDEKLPERVLMRMRPMLPPPPPPPARRS